MKDGTEIDNDIDGQRAVFFWLLNDVGLPPDNARILFFDGGKIADPSIPDGYGGHAAPGCNPERKA